jgi:hypothetical protein
LLIFRLFILFILVVLGCKWSYYSSLWPRTFDPFFHQCVGFMLWWQTREKVPIMGGQTSYLTDCFWQLACEIWLVGGRRWVVVILQSMLFCFIQLLCRKKLEIQKKCYLIHLVQIVMYFCPICMHSIRAISCFSIDCCHLWFCFTRHVDAK